MTEHEWTTGNDPWPLWRYLSETGRLSERKKRLVAVTTCRRVADLLTDPRSRRMLDACEAYADGGLPDERFIELTEDAFDAAGPSGEQTPITPQSLAAAAAKWLGCDEYKVGRSLEFCVEVFGWAGLLQHCVVSGPVHAEEAIRYWEHPVFVAGRSAAERVVADDIREVFGNPLRPASPRESFLTATVTDLALTMYSSRDFAAMPILADALQDAGCEDADVLGHCRGPGPHVRGCWVVDLVLEKS